MEYLIVLILATAFNLFLLVLHIKRFVKTEYNLGYKYQIVMPLTILVLTASFLALLFAMLFYNVTTC